MAFVQQALRKRVAGEPLTPKEEAAIARAEAEEDERRGMRFISAITKKKYGEWSGRHQKVLNEQARLYGMPVGGATINVPDVIGWMHDFLVKWRRELAPLVKGIAADEGGGLKEEMQREQIAMLKRRNRLLENKCQQNDNSLIDRGEIHAMQQQLAKVLRSAGERLQKQFGDEAASILTAALDDFEHTITELAAPKTAD